MQNVMLVKYVAVIIIDISASFSNPVATAALTVTSTFFFCKKNSKMP